MDGVTIIASPSSGHQVTHQGAMALGFAAHGVPTVMSRSGMPIKTHRVACWGWRIGKRLRDAGHSVLVMERGYIGDRFAWTSLAWNGLNNRGTAPAAPDDGGERFDRHFPGMLKPWNPDGDYVLLIGQVPRDASLQGRDLNPWYSDMAERYRGKDVRFRPHPLAFKRGPVLPVPGTTMMEGDLQAALQDACEVVTFNSNTGVDALLAGKPTHVDDGGSMAWNVSDRRAWAHALAWRQWQMSEIESGEALEQVGITDGRV